MSGSEGVKSRHWAMNQPSALQEKSFRTSDRPRQLPAPIVATISSAACYGSAVAYRTEWVEAFSEEVRLASPETRLIIPRHLESIRLFVR